MIPSSKPTVCEPPFFTVNQLSPRFYGATEGNGALVNVCRTRCFRWGRGVYGIYIYHEFILIDQLMGVQNQLIYLDTSRYIWMYNYLGISGYFWTIA
jgi:hypothetical protein